MQKLKQTRIKVLIADWNEIRFNVLPNIEELSVRNNELIDFAGFYANMVNASHLRKVDVSYQSTFFEKPIPDTFAMKLQVQKVSGQHYCQRKCALVWPPKLEWLAFSGLGYERQEMPELFFLNEGSIKYLDQSNSIIETIPEPAHCKNGAISTLEHIDVSNCGIKCMNKAVFDYCVWSLRFFNVSYYWLGLLKGGCNKNPSVKDLATLLRPLKHLMYLDISYNVINETVNDFFENQVKLTEIRASNNEFTSWKPNMTRSIHLELLDLSYNQLTTLFEATILELNELEAHPEYRTTQHVSLYLEGNPLSCNCSNLNFLSWTVKTHVKLENINRYRCISSHRQFIRMSNPNEILASLETECIGRAWLISNILGLPLYFITVTIVTSCYHYRHYIWYVLLRMRMRRERLDALLGRYNEYKYDGFVSCTREGAKWAKRFLLPILDNEETGLKFCVAQRDFIVGKTIIDNIINTISKSRKTILLIDYTFIESKWCNEELLISHNVSNYC